MKTKNDEVIETNVIELEESEYDSLQNELKEWKNKYLYLLAEFDNYKKRRIHEDLRRSEYIYEDLFKEFIPILDNIERAENDIYEPLPQGVKLIFNSIKEIFVKNGLTPYDNRVEFDESIHNAVSTLSLPSYEDNEVVDTLRCGYKYKDKIIRYQDVVVNKINE